jgi:hypothetical protein
VTQPHALVMLKLLALADRYSNIRGPKEARHDREEAQTHAADIVAIVSAVSDIAQFSRLIATQFFAEPPLGIRVHQILADSFRATTSPGLLVYAEYVANSLPVDPSTAEKVRQETDSAQKVIAQILPPPEFFNLADAINDSTEWDGQAPFVEEYLSGLENNRIPVADTLALNSLPSGAFGGAYALGTTFVMSASEPLEKVSPAQRDLLHQYLQQKTNAFRIHQELLQRFPHTLQLAG